jgi:hypothetical protein
MAESDPANAKVETRSERRGDPFERLLRAIQTVGFPIVVAAFLLWEWHSVVRSLQDTMTEVRMLLVEVKHELKNSGK